MRNEDRYTDTFNLPEGESIASVTWLDNSADVEFIQNGTEVTVKTTPFFYGSNHVVRVAKIVIKK
jgi:hypothetical protein